VHIAEEQTKFGLDAKELTEFVRDLHKYELLHERENVEVRGLMGMASFTNNETAVRKEFMFLKVLFDDLRAIAHYPSFNILSMGMSADYKLALEMGSNMVRIGSLLFGSR
jgi:uncharacterized pyridoxal phosphate-containing UPF0001 family protein